VVRSLVERTSAGRLPLAMLEFSDFINSSGLIDPPMEGVCYTWSSHEDVPVLFRINHFLYFVDWEDHFHGVHQIILPKINFPVLLQMRPTFVAKRSLKFENIWLEVDSFSDFVKSVCDDSNVYSSPSFVLAKKLNFLKSKLKVWNRDVFGHLDTKLGTLIELIEKIRVFDAQSNCNPLPRLKNLERLEVKKELPLVRK